MKPIYNELNNEKFKKRIPFHMPGHLRGRGFKDFEFSPYIDVTEIEETDNLNNPTGVIKKSLDNAAKVFGAECAYYLVNGSTSGVLSMVSGFVGEGDKIIADRFCHKSFVSALTITGAQCVWVYPEIINGGTMWSGVKSEDIEDAIKENPDAKAVFLTSPNYFGIGGDIEKISETVHKNGMYLLVDAAHGAHWGMSDKLPPSIISQGADCVCMSLHKTLPSLTQTAILLTNKRYEKVEQAMRMLQSSSPSYIFMSSCEYAVEFYEKCHQKEWDRLFGLVKKYFPEQLECDGEYAKYKDFSRINCPVKGNPFKATEILREKYNIDVECTYGEGIVAILNVFHTEEEIKALRNAVDEISTDEERFTIAPLKCEKVYTPREAFFKEAREVCVYEAAGKISANGIMVYPPGVYQILPGERISSEAVRVITSLLEKGAEIPSLNESNCLIFDE